MESAFSTVDQVIAIRKYNATVCNAESSSTEFKSNLLRYL